MKNTWFETRRTSDPQGQTEPLPTPRNLQPGAAGDRRRGRLTVNRVIRNLHVWRVENVCAHHRDLPWFANLIAKLRVEVDIRTDGDRRRRKAVDEVRVDIVHGQVSG